jgi:hypothetical protein
MDLFSNTDIAPALPRKRVVYQGRNGKFTDKETARLVLIEKERDIYKQNSEYWKRQAERLSAEYKEEHMKVLELAAKLRQTKLYDYDTARKQTCGKMAAT